MFLCLWFMSRKAVLMNIHELIMPRPLNAPQFSALVQLAINHTNTPELAKKDDLAIASYVAKVSDNILLQELTNLLPTASQIATPAPILT